MNIPNCLTLSSSSYISKKDDYVSFKVIFLLDRRVRFLMCAQLDTVKWEQHKAKLTQTPHNFCQATQLTMQTEAFASLNYQRSYACILPTNTDELVKLCRYAHFHFFFHVCYFAWQLTNFFVYNYSLPSFLENCNFGNCLSEWIFFPPCFHYTRIILMEWNKMPHNTFFLILSYTLKYNYSQNVNLKKDSWDQSLRHRKLAQIHSLQQN